MPTKNSDLQYIFSKHRYTFILLNVENKSVVVSRILLSIFKLDTPTHIPDGPLLSWWRLPSRSEEAISALKAHRIDNFSLNLRNPESSNSPCFCFIKFIWILAWAQLQANEDEKGHVYGILLFSPDGRIGPRNQTGHKRHGTSDAAGATSEGKRRLLPARLFFPRLSFLFHLWAADRKPPRLNGARKIESNHIRDFLLLKNWIVWKEIWLRSKSE